MKILLTTTSFQDTPGKHQELLYSKGFEIDTLRGPILENELLPIIDQYDAVICGDDEYTEAVIKKGVGGKLKHLSKYGVGLDRIDLTAAKKYNVSVTNCPSVNQVSVSEHVLALLLTFEKNIHLQYNSVQQGSWKRWVGNEIQGKTIGIIGLGAVGKELAKKSSALGMKVLGFDITKDENFLTKYPEVSFVDSLDHIYKNADVISLHVPHTPQTENLISEDVIFNKLEKSPIIINTARGKLIDVESLIKGLKIHKIKGYLTDVLAHEPILDDEVLKGVENVIITPHVGSRTFQSVERQGLMAVNNLLNQVKIED
ncbi:phosphoglycerate dehydrogenase [Polaribacter sp.]|jgi:D-3-phosphoglycerate dehydrogenase / 2-oxoglutarate reductase|uniref:phosphoglycerate dehydrogenase n=1 Tax=Polaribacter sp. TaxID=1920175 RepID=UPI004048D8C2